MGMNLVYFMEEMHKIKNPKVLAKRRLEYIQKRKHGDHTWSTLAKIRILTTLLMEIELTK